MVDDTNTDRAVAAVQAAYVQSGIRLGSAAAAAERLAEHADRTVTALRNAYLTGDGDFMALTDTLACLHALTTLCGSTPTPTVAEVAAGVKAHLDTGPHDDGDGDDDPGSLGPRGEEFRRVVTVAAALTPPQFAALAAASCDGREDDREAAAVRALGAACRAGRHTAAVAAGLHSGPGEAFAAKIAALTADQLNQAEYDLLTGPWLSVVEPKRPTHPAPPAPTVIPPRHPPEITALITITFYPTDGTGPPPSHEWHLLRTTTGYGHPGATLCGIDRHRTGGQGWTIGGSTGAVGHPCPACAAVAARDYPGLPVIGFGAARTTEAITAAAQRAGEPDTAVDAPEIEITSLTTIQFHSGADDAATVEAHLLPTTTAGEHPGATLCGIDRHRPGGPEWTLGGAGARHRPFRFCTTCRAVARRDYPGLPVRGWVGERAAAADGAGLSPDDLAFLEAAAAMVHVAYVRAMRARGHTSRLSPDGEEQMVPYEQLSQETRDLDRKTVRVVWAALQPLVTRIVDAARADARDGDRG